jgi:hypothetical protein
VILFDAAPADCVRDVAHRASRSRTPPGDPEDPNA